MAANRAQLVLLCVLLALQSSLSRHPYIKQRNKRAVSSPRQGSPSSVLGSLLTFSQRISDMERKINAHNKKIEKQGQLIEELEEAMETKASKLAIQKVKAGLRSSVINIRHDIRLRTNEIERYRGKLRQMEGLFSTTESEFRRTDLKVNELEDRFSQFSTKCRRARTGWNHRANGEIMFLDRHNLKCRSNEFIQSFLLTRRSDVPMGMIRYVFRCCRFNL